MCSVLQVIILCSVILLVIYCLLRKFVYEQYENDLHTVNTSTNINPIHLQTSSDRYDRYKNEPIVANRDSRENCMNPNACCPALIDRRTPDCKQFLFDDKSVFFSTLSINGGTLSPSTESTKQSSLVGSKSQDVSGLSLIPSMTTKIGNNMNFGSYENGKNGKINESISLLDTCNQSIVEHNAQLNTAQTQINTNNDSLHQLNNKLSGLKTNTKSLTEQSKRLVDTVKKQKQKSKQIYNQRCHSKNANTIAMCEKLIAFAKS